MKVTTSLIKELRERTGAGIVDCKKALVKADGDIEAAIDFMRSLGKIKAAKKVGRVTTEGLVNTKISDDNKSAAILEVNCETDFVARGDIFKNFVQELSDIALSNKIDNIDDLNKYVMQNNLSVADNKVNLIAKIGENITIRRIKYIRSNGLIGSYIHGGGRIAVLVAINTKNFDLAKNIAMHICASKPEAIDEKSLSQELIAREQAIFIENARGSGKPDNIIDKIVMGKMKKFIAEATLNGQSYIMDNDTSVGELLKSNNAQVENFVRYEVGEGITKNKTNFVDEVHQVAKS